MERSDRSRVGAGAPVVGGRVRRCGALAVAGVAALAVIGACTSNDGGIAGTPVEPTSTVFVDGSINVAPLPIASTSPVTSVPATESVATNADAQHLLTLPPGSALPDDATCANRVRPASENKTVNQPYNQTRGVLSPLSAPPVAGQPVTGDYSGTTDEILQWAACKWGIDEDIVRAQMAKESGWRMNFQGDFTSDQSLCHPSVRNDGDECPEALGMSQIRPQYHPRAFVNDNAVNSTAYNVDYAYSVWRSCFEGNETWLNDAERGALYVPGDAWGCVGMWYSGRWHTEAANGYIAAVQEYLDQRVWTAADFPNW